MSEYQSDAIPNLPVVGNDLSLVQDALESSGYKVRVFGLGGAMEVTRSHILQHVREECRSAPQDGTLLLYFSGHGLHYDGKDYLVPSDAALTDPSHVQEYLVPVDFASSFDESPAETIVFFIDACREGIELGAKALSLQPWGTGKLELATKRHYAYVYSCHPGEVSRYEGGPKGFSFFTRALADVLHAKSPCAIRVQTGICESSERRENGNSQVGCSDLEHEVRRREFPWTILCPI